MKSGQKQQRIGEYLAIFEEEKDGGFSVRVPDLPGCASQGETLEESISNITEAIELYLDDCAPHQCEENTNRQFSLPIRVTYA